MVNAIEHFGQEATNKIEGMDGDEFYDWWSDTSDFDSNGVKALMLASRTRLTPYGVQITNTNLGDLGLMKGSHANAAKVKQGWLDEIAELVTNGGIVSHINAEDYGITTEYPVEDISFQIFGNPLKRYDGTDNYCTWGGYETLIGLSDSVVYVCHCSGYPPFIKVGAQTTVYHYGLPLTTGLYLIIDSETLIQAPYSTKNDSDITGIISRGCCLTYRNTPGTTWSSGYWYYTLDNARQYSGSPLYYFQYPGSSQDEYIYRGSTKTYDSSTQILSDYQKVAQRIGALLNLNGKSPAITPPSDIPYDNNGDVYMIYNIDSGDTVYMSTGDYNNYVNNGTIIEGDYNQTINDTTINNIRNIMYSDTDTDSSSGGSVNLGVVEGLLRDIKNLLSQIKDKINLDDKITILDGTFGSQPVYDNFSDCVTNNIPLISDVVDVVTSLSPNEDNNGEMELGTHSAAEGAEGVTAIYDGFGIKLSWYAPYRQRIRDVLSIAFYGFGVICCFSYVKSCFGVGGGVNSDV